jgi:hypothetical protein
MWQSLFAAHHMASCQWSNTARPTLPHPLFGLECERRRSVQPDQRRVVALELYFILLIDERHAALFNFI